MQQRCSSVSCEFYGRIDTLINRVGINGYRVHVGDGNFEKQSPGIKSSTGNLSTRVLFTCVLCRVKFCNRERSTDSPPNHQNFCIFRRLSYLRRE